MLFRSAICPPITDFLPHKKINAIKELRARTHLGLKEAKDGIEYYEAHYASGAVSGFAPATVRTSGYPYLPTPALGAEWIEHDPVGRRVKDHMTSKTTAYKIYAIKEMRALTSLGLKEAKDAVELWEKVYG